MSDRRGFPAGRLPVGWRIILGLGLAYWAWMMVDLASHPLAAGPNEGGALFRWLSALTGTFTIVTALFILRRVPGNPVSLLLFAWGLGNAGWSIRSEWVNVQVGNLVRTIFGFTFLTLSVPAIVLMLFYFPDGKPQPPRLRRWMPVMFALLGLPGLLSILATPTAPMSGIPNPLYIPALGSLGQQIFLVSFIIGTTAGLISLVLRYRAGDARQRKQLKWLIFLLAIGIMISLDPFNLRNTSFLSVFIRTSAYLFWQSFPAVAIAIAVLRHKLWDIDLIIRRTLVYGVLTATLGLAYFGSVVLLQNVFDIFVSSADQSPVVIVISTLLVAALFNPLRRRIQEGIDRRFYRKRYDAEHTLQNFASATRNQVDMEELSGLLVGVVRETMQPETISVWLRAPGKPGPRAE